METDGRGNHDESHPQQHHFVLVHGICHGAWCWYKVTTALRRAGHRVTALDMAGCGAHPARVDEVRSFEEYSRPLLDALAALPSGERVVLVGNSFGGYSVALAAERFPDKVAAAVFLTAFMPAVGRSMAAATTDEFAKFVGAIGSLPDFLDTSHEPVTIFGPKCMAQMLYQLSPPEDLTLALSLIRPANRFNEDALMTDEKLLTEAGYGSARRVFVVVEDDLGIPAGFQRRMIAQSPGVEVEAMTAGGADHMPMVSRPQEVVDLLLRIAAIQA